MNMHIHWCAGAERERKNMNMRENEQVAKESRWTPWNYRVVMSCMMWVQKTKPGSSWRALGAVKLLSYLPTTILDFLWKAKMGNWKLWLKVLLYLESSFILWSRLTWNSSSSPATFKFKLILLFSLVWSIIPGF